MTELKGFYGVNLFIDQNELRFGAIDQEKSLFQRHFNRQILQSHIRLLQIQNHYANSYLSSSDPTVGQVKDLLFSLAINFSLRSSQCVDRSNTKLTTHANRFWKSAYGTDFASYIFSDSDVKDYDGFGGVVGSVAYSFINTELNFNNPNLTPNKPITLLKYYLDSFWTQNNINFTSNPRIKNYQLLSRIFSSSLPLEQIEQILNSIYFKLTQNLEPEEKPIYYLMRRTMINNNHWLNLRQRFIMGEISPELLKILKTFILQSNQSDYFGLEIINILDLERISNNILKESQPGGFVLYYLAFAVQGLIEAAIRLSSLSDDNLNTSFRVWCSQITNKEIKLKLISDLYTTIDAFDCLSLFNSIEEAKEFSYKIYLLAVQLLPQEEFNTKDTRLLKFIDFNRNEPIKVGDLQVDV